MRALRFNKTGSLDDLIVADVPAPVPGEDELLIRVKAAAINPSDVKSVLGRMHETTAPRTPGRDFAGVVAQGPPDLLGKSVFGTGGSLGFRRDGSHAEFLAVPRAAVLPLPKGFSFEQAAGTGLAYMTAWQALVNDARLQPGETALILGATGAVGGAGTRIARSLGALVLGTVRSKSDIPTPGTVPVDIWIDLATTDLAVGCRDATFGKGADVIFDVVGGAMFEKCLSALALRGRQVAISSGATPWVTFHLADFYHNESRLIGVDSVKLGFSEAAAILREIVPHLESGEFPPPEVQNLPLDRGPEAYRDIEAGRLKGKIVLIP
jgi:NADPH:quinone reductase-like Zn-dependent oxidoreductase